VFISIWEHPSIIPCGTPYGNIPATVYPTYYSWLFMAEVLGDISSPTILELSAFGSSTLAAYAIYNGSRLSKIVVLNLAFFNGTSSERPIQAIDLSGVLGRILSVTRLTGTSSASTSVEDTIWAGQTYATGKADGTRVTEKCYNGLVQIAASEGIIIQAM
jgi:hypothetical protein